MPSTEIGTRDLQTLITRAKDASEAVISRDSGSSIDLGIDGIAVVGMAWDDDFLKHGARYQMYALAVEHTISLNINLFCGVLSSVALQQAQVTLVHEGNLFRPQGETFDIAKWREVFKYGKRSYPAFKVFLGREMPNEDQRAIAG